MVKTEVSISLGLETVPGCDRQTELPQLIRALAMLCLVLKNVPENTQIV